MDYKEYNRRLFYSTLKLIIFTSMISILIACLNFIVPLMLPAFINNYDADANFVLFAIILFSFYILAYLARMLLNLIFKNYSIHFKTREHMKLFEIMFRMKYDKLNRYEPTYLVERITVSANTLYDVYAESISKIVVAVVSIAIALGITLTVNKIITVILVILLIVQVFGYKQINKALANKCIHLQEASANSFKNIISVTSNVDYIKQLGKHSGILNVIESYVKALYKENAIVNKFAKDISTTIATVITILQNFVYIFAAISMIQNQITSAEFILISMVSSLYMSGLSDIVNININIRDMKGVKKFIQEELMNHLESEDGVSIEEIQTIDYDIHNFGYSESETLIETGFVHVQRGDVVMIHGASGSGKTSLCKGLLKLVHVDSIKINEIDIDQISNESLRAKVQLFSQNIPIITGTIKDNITLGEDVDPEIFEALSTKSFLKKFYDLPDGLDTVILENGSNLSGGDKQKIALAKLYLESPDVIILDESTNSIDEESSYEIINSIINEFNHKIIFIISHDSHVMSFCNKIVTIKDKVLTEEHSY